MRMISVVSTIIETLYLTQSRLPELLVHCMLLAKWHISTATVSKIMLLQLVLLAHALWRA